MFFFVPMGILQSWDRFNLSALICIFLEATEFLYSCTIRENLSSERICSRNYI